jgi:hypothetical protein
MTSTWMWTSAWWTRCWEGEALLLTTKACFTSAPTVLLCVIHKSHQSAREGEGLRCMHNQTTFMISQVFSPEPS